MKQDCQVRSEWLPPHWLTIAIGFLILFSHQAVAQQRGELSGSPSSSSAPACDLARGHQPLSKSAQKNLKQYEAELALGSRLAADVDRNTTLITDTLIVQYVNSLEHRIVGGSELPGCFNVKVINDPEPNAYSLPGGFIYLTTGLLHLVENEAQLATALAHETGHVAARHLTRIDGQARMWRRLALLGGPVGYAVRRFVGPLLTVKLLRNREYEADGLGLRYQIAAGYDPLESCALLELAFSQEVSESFFERLYDTHPPTNVRIERLQKNNRMLRPTHSSYLVNTSDFVEMKLRLESVMSTPGR